MKAPSIRRRLTALVLATAVPAALLVAALIAYEHQRDRQRVEQEAIGTARTLALAVDRELIGVELAARVLATSHRAHTGDFEGFRQRAEEVVATGVGDAVVLADRDGQQVVNTLRKPGEPLPKNANLPLLREVLATGRPVVSGLFVGGVLGRPLASVAVPVVSDGVVTYMLGIGVRAERFRALLDEQKLPEGWIGAVYDRSGTVVARTQEQERRVGTKGAPRLLRRIAETPEDTLEAVTEEGIPVVAAFSRSPVTGWAVVLGIPRASLVAPLWRRSLLAAGIAAAMLALGFALAWSIGGSIAR